MVLSELLHLITAMIGCGGWQMIQAQQVDPAAILVYPDSSGTGNPTQFTTAGAIPAMDSALSFAPAGSMIVIPAGYSELMTTTHWISQADISIRCASSDTVTFSAGASSIRLFSFLSSGSITGCNLSGSHSASGYFDVNAVTLGPAVTSFTFENNVVQDMYGPGLSILACSIKCTVRGNQFLNFGNGTVADGSEGIVAFDFQNLEIDGNVFRTNTSSDLLYARTEPANHPNWDSHLIVTNNTGYGYYRFGFEMQLNEGSLTSSNNVWSDPGTNATCMSLEAIQPDAGPFGYIVLNSSTSINDTCYKGGGINGTYSQYSGCFEDYSVNATNFQCIGHWNSGIIVAGGNLHIDHYLSQFNEEGISTEPLPDGFARGLTVTDSTIIEPHVVGVDVCFYEDCDGDLFSGVQVAITPYLWPSYPSAILSGFQFGGPSNAALVVTNSSVLFKAAPAGAGMRYFGFFVTGNLPGSVFHGVEVDNEDVPRIGIGFVENAPGQIDHTSIVDATYTNLYAISDFSTADSIDYCNNRSLPGAGTEPVATDFTLKECVVPRTYFVAVSPGAGTVAPIALPANGMREVMNRPGDGSALTRVRSSSSPPAGTELKLLLRTPSGPAWSSGTIYCAGCLVLSPDRYAYVSIAAGNINHNPIDDVARKYWNRVRSHRLQGGVSGDVR